MKDLYVAMTGAIAQERRLTAIANNLANATSVGFKRDTVVFQMCAPEIDAKRVESSVSSELNLPSVRQKLADVIDYVQVAETSVDFSSGTIVPSDRTLDLAIEERNPTTEGRAFLTVQTNDGPRYTRMGNLTVNTNKELVTQDGLKVIGQNKLPITIQAADFAIGTDGTVSDGTQPIATIQLAWAENPAGLQKQGYGLFSDPKGEAKIRTVKPTDDVEINQGYLESSNVNVVDELIRMIDTQRYYNTFQKSIQSIDDASSKMVGQVLNN
jgi:flagellar basal body rod protein FlgG